MQQSRVALLQLHDLKRHEVAILAARWQFIESPRLCMASSTTRRSIDNPNASSSAFGIARTSTYIPTRAWLNGVACC